jgi:CubicO group peptidase (beta-lactamase class C family)
MGEYIPEVDVPDIYGKLESLIRCQLTEEKSVDEVLTAFESPIVSVGMMDDGDITATMLGSPKPRLGTTVLDSGETFNTDTLFQAASISKAITALAVIKLCQEGKLDLDAPISQYLNREQILWISTPTTQALASQISLRLLLSHTAGLRVHGFEGYSTADIPTLPQILRGDPPANNEQISLFTLPGLEFSYSGGGYTLIQLVLETHLQKPFPQIMKETVLRPLKLNRSFYGAIPEKEKNYAPAYLTGKNQADPDHHTYPELPAAALWTTPSDLLKAVHAVQRSLDSDDFLDRKWAEAMLTQPNNDNNDNNVGMALGWVAKHGTNYFWHNGSNPPGYVSLAVGYAALPQRETKQDDENGNKSENGHSIPKGCGICVMTSSALGVRVVLMVLQAIAYFMGWPSLVSGLGVPFLDRSRTIDGQAKH